MVELHFVYSESHVYVLLGFFSDLFIYFNLDVSCSKTTIRIGPFYCIYCSTSYSHFFFLSFTFFIWWIEAIVCISSLWVLRLPPTGQRHACPKLPVGVSVWLFVFLCPSGLAVGYTPICVFSNPSPPFIQFPCSLLPFFHLYFTFIVSQTSS